MLKSTEKRLNYLGYPISQNAHYGNFSEMRQDPVLYMARTCQASMNLQALMSPSFAKAWRFKLREVSEFQPDIIRLRNSYDSTFRLLYERMQTALPNGMTLEEGCLQLRPKKLHAELCKMQTADPTLRILLDVALSLECLKEGIANSERAAVEDGRGPC